MWRQAWTYLCFGVFAPVWVPQALWLRRSIPRLPEALGPFTGWFFCPEAARNPQEAETRDEAEALRLVVIGESTAAGVGASSHQVGLAGQLAEAWSLATEHPVTWEVRGANGYEVQRTHRELFLQVESAEADLVVIVQGVNDVLSFRSARQWHRDMCALLDDVSLRWSCPVLIATMPPMRQFPALPRPTRWVFGLWAEMLEAVTIRLAAQRTDVHYAHLPMSVVPDQFCEDRFHPSEKGYREWAQAMIASWLDVRS